MGARIVVDGKSVAQNFDVNFVDEVLHDTSIDVDAVANLLSWPREKVCRERRIALSPPGHPYRGAAAWSKKDKERRLKIAKQKIQRIHMALCHAHVEYAKIKALPVYKDPDKRTKRK